MDSTVSAMDIAMEVEPDSQTKDTTISTIAGTTADVEMGANDAQTIRIFNMGGNSISRMEKMQNQGRSILTLCRHSCRSIAPDRAKEMENRFADALSYLEWLDTNVEMTPRIKEVAKIELILDNITNPAHNIPEQLVSKANELLIKYKDENWGRDAVAEEEPAPQDNSVEVPTSIATIQLPAANDATFGIGGIMYGIVIDTSGKRKDYRLRADIPRKSAKVYGHNDIALGTWFPFQINALFWGAHGARMGGIAGNVMTGAWSIVVAGTYEDLDTDNGDVLYYSGSNSHENSNPLAPAPASQGTKALFASINTRNPVRVIRSGGASNVQHQNRHLPICGLRYDGLYRVMYSRRRTNGNGGLYDQFMLQRLPDQTPLDELKRTSPTPQQIFAHDRLRGRN
ncbi:hypothetical protein ONZ43_g5333 [Nemania bipapillata]|uniref:Uncharacterized protein n=1 Tax=Nemania bipapillata TaxID=110536 RepID=A0ACC2IBX7_9PEZI|nr:hypothetical protein ONZ43_g5333 [Nemania bipapillata]